VDINSTTVTRPVSGQQRMWPLMPNVAIAVLLVVTMMMMMMMAT